MSLSVVLINHHRRCFLVAHDQVERAIAVEIGGCAYAGGGIRGGQVYGSSDKIAAYPKDNPVSPEDFLATIYHAMGINPATLVYNHLNQPRELVQGEVVTGLFA